MIRSLPVTRLDPGQVELSSVARAMLESGLVQQPTSITLSVRMAKLLILGDAWPPRLTFATEWPRANAGGVERIREWAKARERPRLVIVDVLTMFRPPASGKDSTYEHDYNSIKALQALAGELRIAIIVVHHTRKSREQIDPFDRVSGTLGLSGAADSVLILDRNGQGVTLYGRGRDITEIESAVTFDLTLCRWAITGPAAEVRLSDERKVIAETLFEALDPLTPAEVADAIKRPRNSVKQLLFKMLTAGAVIKIDRGRYVHPARKDLQNSPLCLPPITNSNQ